MLLLIRQIDRALQKISVIFTMVHCSLEFLFLESQLLQSALVE